MNIPLNVIEAATVSLDAPVVRGYISEVCQAGGLDPATAPVHLSGTPLAVYTTLHAANENARNGRPWISPYQNPEDTMLGDLMIEYLSAAERMQVRTSPPHLRMDVARELLDEKFRSEDLGCEAG